MTRSNATLAAYAFIITFVISFPAATQERINIHLWDQNGSSVSDAVISIDSAFLSANAYADSDISVMDQVDMMFQPYVLVVNKNQRVSFPNSDNIRHHVYSFSKPKSFELRLYRGNETAPIEMSNAGVVELGCNIHDDMRGFIFVNDMEYSVLTDTLGVARYNISLPADTLKTATVWHPSLSTSLGERKIVDLRRVSADLFEAVIDMTNANEHVSNQGFIPKFSPSSGSK